MSKLCPKCGELLTAEAYHRDGAKKDGLYTICKECRKFSSVDVVKKRASDRSYYYRNRDVIRRKQKLWKDEHREEIRVQRELSRDKYNAATRRWKAINKERVSRYNKRYRKDHPEISVHHEALRRIRLGAVQSPVDIKKICKAYEMICYLCEKPIDEGDLHMDHIVPIVKGGIHTEENLAPTHSQCNLSKHIKSLEEYWSSISPGAS